MTDELAIEGIDSNNVDRVLIKAARQRKTVAARQQTKLVTIWLNRQELQVADKLEPAALDEEAAAVAELEAEFTGEPSQDRHD